MEEDFTGHYLEDIMDVARIYWKEFLLLLPGLLLALVILGATWIISKKVQRLFEKKINRTAKDPLLLKYLSVVFKWLVIILGLMLALNTVGLKGVAAGILAGAGISALIFGFAFKDIAENFLAGVILAFDRPFDINDNISIKGISGVIEGLSLRTIHLRTFDGQDIFIPNATVLKSEVINMTKNNFIRHDFKIETENTVNIPEFKVVIYNALTDIKEVYHLKEPFIIAEEIQPQKIIWRVYFWVETQDYQQAFYQLKGVVIENVQKLMMKNGYWKN